MGRSTTRSTANARPTITIPVRTIAKIAGIPGSALSSANGTVPVIRPTRVIAANNANTPCAKLKTEDALATFVKIITDLVFKKVGAYNPAVIILVGGGRKNNTLRRSLNDQFKGIVVSAEDIGWDGDSLEAQAFAYLAVRCFLGLNITFPDTTGVLYPSSGGVLHSYYEDN